MTLKKKFFCPLPWVHLSMEPQGNVFMCCNASEFKPLENVNSASYKKIFNGDQLKMIRDKFSRGEIPSECVLCVESEKRGQISLREASVFKFSDVGPSTVAKLKYLSLRLNNTCNYACRICTPELSTAWYKDVHLAGRSVPKGNVKAFQDIDRFKEQMEDCIDDLELIYLAGGEPLIAPEVQLLLEFLLSKGRHDIELLINTNFSKPNPAIMKLLSQFKVVYLDLSLDGMGERGEYMRHGMNWRETEERARTFKHDYPTIHLKLFPTVSAFNVVHLSDFLDYFLTNKYVRPSDVRINMLTSPMFMSLHILPQNIKRKAKDKLTLFKLFLITTYKEPSDQGLAVQISGLINALNEPSKEDLIPDFLKEAQIFDEIRKQNIFEVFPELEGLNSQVTLRS